jgi:hypothetical protein
VIVMTARWTAAFAWLPSPACKHIDSHRGRCGRDHRVGRRRSAWSPSSPSITGPTGDDARVSQASRRRGAEGNGQVTCSGSLRHAVSRFRPESPSGSPGCLPVRRTSASSASSWRERSPSSSARSSPTVRGGLPAFACSGPGSRGVRHHGHTPKGMPGRAKVRQGPTVARGWLKTRRQT